MSTCYSASSVGGGALWQSSDGPDLLRGQNMQASRKTPPFLWCVCHMCALPIHDRHTREVTSYPICSLPCCNRRLMVCVSVVSIPSKLTRPCSAAVILVVSAELTASALAYGLYF